MCCAIIMVVMFLYKMGSKQGIFKKGHTCLMAIRMAAFEVVRPEYATIGVGREFQIYHLANKKENESAKMP